MVSLTKKLSIVRGQYGDGLYFLSYGSSLWRIEPDGQIGADKLSQESFRKVYGELIDSHQDATVS